MGLLLTEIVMDLEDSLGGRLRDRLVHVVTVADLVDELLEAYGYNDFTRLPTRKRILDMVISATAEFTSIPQERILETTTWKELRL